MSGTRGAHRSVTATLVFTDLVGSTELSARLGPDGADALRSIHYGLLRSAVTQHGGVEVKNLGDGLMLSFSSVRAALDAAVAMQQAIAGHNRRGGEPLGVRIGIASGEATEEEGDYFGEPVVEAARLCALAPGGGILTTETVRVLARRTDHRFADVGERILKGLPDPVSVVEVGWEPAPTTATVPLPARLAAPHPGGFVGRTPEREAIDCALAAAWRGERHIVLVAGEPGIGKTRLSAEVAAAAHAQGATVLYGRCDQDLGIPYQPWGQALGHLVAHLADDRLSAHVDRHGGDLARLVPELGRRIGGLPSLRTDDPEMKRYLLWGAMSGLLAEAGVETPVVVVLDDLHWADAPTLQFLRHLSGLDTPLRLLLIGTYRDTETGVSGHALADLLAALRREPGVERIRLVGLEQSEVVDLMSGLAGHDMDATGLELARALWQEADGNPFFTGELLRHLAESGSIRRGQDGRWVTTAEVGPESLPPSVREVIGLRVRRLGERAVDLLGIAAVIGQHFDLDLLARVDGTDEMTVLELLDRASQAALVTELAGTPGRYGFVHALIQRSLYSELSAARRVRLHRRTAEALEAMCGGAPGTRVGELARHWAAVVAPVEADKAIHYAVRAAERALAVLAPEEAVRWYEQALGIVAGSAVADEHARCRLLVDLGDAQRQAGGHAYRQTLLEAARLARSLGDSDLLVRAALAMDRGLQTTTGEVDADRIAVLEAAIQAAGSDDTPARARLLASLAAELAYDPDYSRRKAIADEAIAVSRRVGHGATLAGVLSSLVHALHIPSLLGERLEQTAEAVALAATLDDPIRRFWAAYAHLYAAIADCDLEASDRCLAELTAIAARLRQPTLSWFAGYLRVWRVLLTGDAVNAERVADQTLKLGSDSGQPDAFLLYGADLQTIRWHQGRVSEILPQIEQLRAITPNVPALAAAQALAHAEGGDHEAARRLLDGASQSRCKLPYDVNWLVGTVVWAEAAYHVGHRDAAAALYERLAPWHDRIAFNGACVLGPVAHYLGLLAIVLGRTEVAETHFAEALPMVERLGAPFHIARTKLEWGRLLLDRDRERATALLIEARALAAENGCAGVGRRAEEALSQGER